MTVTGGVNKVRVSKCTGVKVVKCVSKRCKQELSQKIMCASKNFCILIASCAAYFSLVLLIRVLCLILSNFSLYHCRL